MYSKILILHFPPDLTQKAVVCQLTKQFDILFNIMRARISNKKEGYMVMEMSSVSKTNFNKGVKYLKDQNIKVSTPEHEIWKDTQICTHCGACTAVCPTDALYIKRPEMEVLFDRKKCSVCEICILTCPYRAISLFSKTPEEDVI